MRSQRNRALPVVTLLLAVLLVLLAVRSALVAPPAAKRASAADAVTEDAADALRRRHVGAAGADDAAAAENEPGGVLPSPQLPRISRLDFRVTDALEASPVRGAAVTFSARDGSRLDAVSDDSGLAVLQQVPWCAGRVRVTAPGYAMAELGVEPPPLGGRRAATVRLRPGSPLRVVVRDAWTREPVGGVRVRAFDPSVADGAPNDPSECPFAEAVTRADGTATLPSVPRGACVLHVEGTGRETALCGWLPPSEPEGDAAITLWTSPAGVVRGRVTDASGAPWPGITVRVSWRRAVEFRVTPVVVGPDGVQLTTADFRSGGTTDLWRPLAAETDADGRYRIEGVRRGPPFWVAALDEDGRALCDAVTRRIGRDEAEVEEDLVVARMRASRDAAGLEPDAGVAVGEAAVAGRVVDAAGEPVDDARVWVAGASHATYSLPDGTFEICGLPPGPCTLRATASRKARASIECSAPGRGVLLRLDAAVVEPFEIPRGNEELVLRFVAVVSGEGPPPASLLVFVPVWTARLQWTGGATRREFRVTVPGNVLRRAGWIRLAGPGFAPQRIEVTVPDGVSVVDLGEVTIDTGLAASGVVVDDTGAPIEGATVTVRAKDGGGGDAVTGADGRFIAGGLRPGPADVSVVAPRHGEGKGTVAAGTAADDVRIVLVRLRRVDVRVRDEEGLPVLGARVRTGRGDDAGQATTDRSGKATVWLSPGRHVVRAYDPGTRTPAPTREVQIERGQAPTEVVLELRRGDAE